MAPCKSCPAWDSAVNDIAAMLIAIVGLVLIGVTTLDAEIKPSEPKPVRHLQP